MLIAIYIFITILSPFIRFLCYRLGRKVTEENINSKVRKLNFYSILNAIIFILIIPIDNDGTLLSAFINILNMLLSGLIGYSFVLAFKRGMRDEEFENDFMELWDADSDSESE